MAKWNCGVCGQIHESTEVGYNCPNYRKNSKYNHDNLTEFEKQVQRFYGSKTWRNTRQAIIRRDKYCQRCINLYGLYTYETLEVHHIKKINYNWELRLNLDNLITVCKTCHRQIDKSLKDGELDFEFNASEIQPNIY